MAITTYTELQSAITNWLGGRSDIATARITECIALFEAGANRRLRVQQQELKATLTPSGGSAALPTDFLACKVLTRVSGGILTVLQFNTYAYLNSLFPTYPAGTPQWFSISAGNIDLYPYADDDISLTYYQATPALSDSATTNWLLTAHPDLYLFGSLAELESLLENDSRVQMWISRRDAIYDEIEKLSNKSHYQSGTRVSVMAETP